MQNLSLSFFQKKKKALEIIIKNNLTSRQKQCIFLYYYKNKNMSEIAKNLNLSVSTVSRHIAKAKKIILEKSEYFVNF